MLREQGDTLAIQKCMPNTVGHTRRGRHASYFMRQLIQAQDLLTTATDDY